MYAAQAYVSTLFLPEEQKKQMRIFMFISPIMILWISFISPSALPLYWAVGGVFLVLQTIIGNLYYRNKVEEEMAPIIARHEEEQKEKERKKKSVQVAPSKKRK